MKRSCGFFAVLINLVLLLSGCGMNNYISNPGITTGPAYEQAGAEYINSDASIKAAKVIDESQAQYKYQLPALQIGTAMAESRPRIKNAEDYYKPITGDFSLLDADDREVEFEVFPSGEKRYLISRGGKYRASGLLNNGSIVITVPETEKVRLELENAVISSFVEAPVVVVSAAKVELKAVKESYNEIVDKREAESGKNDSGKKYTAAVYSCADVELSGSGAVKIESLNYSGIRSEKDIEITNGIISVHSKGHAVKGDDSVTIGAAEILLVAAEGDGIKTVSNDVSRKGKQRGNIQILGGRINIYSACEGMDAAGGINVSDSDVVIYTAGYSPYTQGCEKTDEYYILTDSNISGHYSVRVYYTNDNGEDVYSTDARYAFPVLVSGIKYYAMSVERPLGYHNMQVLAEMDGSSDKIYLTDIMVVNEDKNALVLSSVSSESIACDWDWATVSAFDSYYPNPDRNGEKTDYSSKGMKALNGIYLNGSYVDISAMDDGMNAKGDIRLASGEKGRGLVKITGSMVNISSADDAVHADSEITVESGMLNIVRAYEGLESNVINYNDGIACMHVFNDGINACKGSKPAQFVMNGGSIDISITAGNVYAVDVKGSYTHNSGMLITRGHSGNSQSAGSVYASDGIELHSGCIVALGRVETIPQNFRPVRVMSGERFGAGVYKLISSTGEEIAAFYLDEEYESGWICTDRFDDVKGYFLTRDGETFLRW